MKEIAAAVADISAKTTAAAIVTLTNGGGMRNIIIFLRLHYRGRRYLRTSKMLYFFVRRHYTTSVDKLNYHRNNVSGKRCA